jgi:Asp-tRNA(Asn)/Glu-tRNA(Gln) amidotransferase A subunit family amidase
MRSTLKTIEHIDSDVAAFVCTASPDRPSGYGELAAPTGPLAGTAVGVKDLFRVDGMPTRAGSRLPADLFDGPESVVVKRLRAAGAWIVGKTAMDEFAYCEPPPTRNPLDPRRTPGGSSGGSAAAVAAGMCPLTVGSQTLLSTIVPASYCGIVGYKPTFDRLSSDGVPMAPSIDTVGFLASSMELVRTAAEQVLPGWRAIPDSGRPVLGVPPRWGPQRRHDQGWEAFDRHVETLTGAGFEIRRARLPWNDDLESWASVIRDQLHGEMASVHADWYARYADLYRPRTRQGVERGQAVGDQRLAECRAAQGKLRDMLRGVTAGAGVDCWICPSAGSVAPGEGDRRDSWMTSFWSYAGWPSISIPIFDGPDGLPHGLQCVAPAAQDEELLAWGHAISTALPPRRHQ